MIVAKEKSVKIERIKIRKLFNRFDYDFNFKNGCNISILIAPNGSGKTTIFRIIDFLIEPTREKFEEIKNIPFKKFECDLSNGEKLILSNTKISDHANNKSSSGSECYEMIYKIGNVKAIINERFLYSLVDYYSIDPLGLPRVCEEPYYNYDPTLEIKELDDQLKNGNINPIDYKIKRFQHDIKKIEYEKFFKLKEIRNDFDKFIVENLKPSKLVEKFRNRLKFSTSEVLIEYVKSNRLFVKDCAENVKDAVAVANDKIQEGYVQFCAAFDEIMSQFNNQIISCDEEVKFSEEEKKEIKDNFDDCLDILKAFSEIGLLKSMLSEEKLNLIKSNFYLMKKLKDVLAPPDSLFSPLRFFLRLSLLLDILNENYGVNDKKFSFEQEDGIVFRVDGEKIQLECMSSGEKNNFLMFFDLIFYVFGGNLIDCKIFLIDEPEISLHINWQESFIDNLLKICEINDCQIIVATHSPHILNDHLELVL